MRAVEADRVRECDGCRREACSWIFSGLTDDEFSQFTRLVKHVQYEGGETVFQEGALAFGLHIVCQGKVKVTGKAPCGKRQILKILGAGEVLGEEALFSDGSYTAFARTLEPSTLAFVPKESFLEFTVAYPGVTLQLVEKLSRELVAFQGKLIEVAYESSEERLARLLVVMGERFGRVEGRQLDIGLNLSRAELAELAGIAPETAIRTLSRLREQGLLQLEGHRINILDLDGLQRLARPLPVAVRENLL